MMNKLKAAHEETSCYSDSEISSMRQQLKKGNAHALSVFTEEKYPLDPRIEEARKKRASA